MNAADGHKVVIVETDCMTVIEARSRLAIPFHAVSWFCTAKVLHRSQVSEWEVQWGAGTCCKHHCLALWTVSDMVERESYYFQFYIVMWGNISGRTINCRGFRHLVLWCSRFPKHRFRRFWSALPCPQFALMAWWLFFLPHQLMGFYYWNGACLLHGMNWIFNCYWG